MATRVGTLMLNQWVLGFFELYVKIVQKFSAGILPESRDHEGSHFEDFVINIQICEGRPS